MDGVLLAQVAATMAMVGVIWFVQLVHYPMFALVGRDGAVAYANAHTRRTTWVVGPAMAVEGATALLVAARPPAGVPAWLPWAGLALLALVWASTWLLQVPCHRILARGPDPGTVRRLVRTNWVRTAGWSARGAVALAMAATAAG